MTSVRLGCPPPIWKQGQVQRLKESRLTNQRGRGSGPFRLWGLDKARDNRLVSQSTTLQERYVHGWKRGKYKTYRPLDDLCVILMTSNAFHYYRDESCAFEPIQFVYKNTIETGWLIPFDTCSGNDIAPNLDKSSERTSQTFSESYDIWNPVSTVLKWFKDFRMEIKNCEI